MKIIKFKKGLILLMILMLLASLGITGCSDESTVGDANSSSKTELDIFQFKVEIADQLEEAARKYEETHPNIKINIQTVGGGDDYGAALKTALQSGNEPDIFNVGGPQDVEDHMFRLENLSDQSWVNKAFDGVLSGVTVGDKIYGLPYNLEGYGFVYNTEIFEEAGINPEKIVSFKALEEAVKLLDRKIKSGELKDKYPRLEAVFEFPAKETWITGLHTSNVALGQEFESSIDAYNSKELEFKYSDSFKKIIDLQTDYSPYESAKQKLNAVDYTTQVEEGIAIERVAMIQQGNWIFEAVKNVDESVANKLDILPIPLEGGKEDCIPVGVPMYWVVNKNSDEEEKNAAKDFLNWLYTSEEGKDYVVNRFHFIPPLKGYEDLEVNDPLGKAISKYVTNGKTIPWVFMGYPTGWGEKVLGQNIQKYLSGKLTWENAISESQDKWKEMR